MGWEFILELVLEILEQSFFTQDLKPDYQALRTWALVCKSVARDAQRLLYRDVQICSRRKTVSFLSALAPSNPNATTLSSYICRLEIHCDKDAFSEQLLVKALGCCPNVYELSLHLPYGRPTLDASSIAALSSASKLRALSISIVNEYRDRTEFFDLPRISATSRILDALPNLEFFTINGADEISHEIGARSPPMQLYELCWNVPAEVLDERPEAAQRRFDWLLPNSVKTLRVLRFEDVVDKRLLRHLGTMCGKQLESLTLLKRPDKHQNVLGMFPALRELVLGWVNCEDMKAVIDACPAKIEHLAVKGIRAENIDELVHRAKTSEWLKAITYFHVEEVDMRELQDVCRHRGIVLSKCYRFPPRVQPLKAPDFPRVSSLSNYRKMQNVC